MPEAPSFDKDLFTFLTELKANNERAWFTANKARYEDKVKEPALAFVEDFELRLGDAAPHLTAGKLFRIYRDTRFAKDKTPYKTHVGMWFRHTGATDMDTPGVYVHLEPRSVFMGAGIWHPSGPSLKRIRDRMVNQPAGWQNALEAVGPTWQLADGDALKRPPKGYDPEHPLVEDLKRKNFAVMTQLTQKDATGSGFLDTCEARVREVRPFVAFLADALGVDY